MTLAAAFLTLPIGTAGTVDLPGPGLYAMPEGVPATVEQVVDAAEDVRFVFVGESHDQAAHHAAQGEIIRALGESRPISVGFEMFTFDNQDALNGWNSDNWDEAEFIARSNWETQWGFDFAMYRPVFEAAVGHDAPMVALNVPRTWVRTVSRQGFDQLPEDARSFLGRLDLSLDEHRDLFYALIGGHPMGGGDGMYAAQVTWDIGMARNALRHMSEREEPNAAMVVLAGIGHTLYGVGINARIERWTGERTLHVACLTSDESLEVARGIADFVWVTPADAQSG